MGLAKRIIPGLDVDDGHLVAGVEVVRLHDAGAPFAEHTVCEAQACVLGCSVEVRR